MADQVPQVVMRSGPIPGSSFFLEKDEILIGRDLANDIPVPDAEISRRHARFIRKSDGVYIEDLGSTNGTFLNGVRLSSPHILRHGDLITLAQNTVMSFEQPPAASQAAAQPAAENLYEPTPAPRSAPAPAVPTPPAPSTPRKKDVRTAEAPKPKKHMGWFATFLLILLIAMIIIGLVLLFMPANWWCALTFNGLTGCPIN